MWLSSSSRLRSSGPKVTVEAVGKRRVFREAVFPFGRLGPHGLKWRNVGLWSGHVREVGSIVSESMIGFMAEVWRWDLI